MAEEKKAEKVKALAERLSKEIEGEVRLNVALKDYTTLQVGGAAALMVFPHTVDDLAAVLSAASETDWPPLVFGNGSNLLVKDSGYQGVVIKMECFSKIEFSEDTVYVEAGALLPRLIRQAQEVSLGGLEFLWGIPASVGGALKMNAGAFGSEICDLVTEVVTMDFQGKINIIPRKKLDFSYRYADINKQVVVGGKFSLRKLPLDDILNTLKKVKDKRSKTQPLDRPSAGSIFKNPPGKFAGQLIEQAGLKGFRLGGAEISSKHANFIVTDKGATAANVLELIALIKERVKERFDVDLTEEVVVVG